MVKKNKTNKNSVTKKITESEKKILINLASPPHLTATKLTFGQKSLDKLTKIAGSWGFIIFFFVFLGCWMFINVTGYRLGIWDKYPFILLNLVLSCLAAIQAPIILMSQNRAAQRDRIRAEYDYSVNRKSERGIRELRKTLDKIERKLK